MSDSLCVLVDGSGFVYRAFYAMPPLSRSDGVPVGAVLGFTGMLMNLLESHASGVFIVAFDSSRKNFRNEIYPSYKSNRSEVPEDLIPQFSIVREACKAFDISTIEMEGFEADDLIATYSNYAKERGYKVRIVSSDKDLCQLMDTDIEIFDPIKKKNISEQDVIEKYGITPKQFLDFQSLAGDSTDNIPGIKGIGPKTAAKLINTYGSLDDIFDNIPNVEPIKLREKLSENKDLGLISRQLVTLRKDAPMPLPFDECTCKAPRPEKVREFLEKQNFKSLLGKFERFSGRFKAVSECVMMNGETDVHSFMNKAIETGKVVCEFFHTESSKQLELGESSCEAFALCYDGNAAVFNIPKNQWEKVLSKYLSDETFLKIGSDTKSWFRLFPSVHIKAVDDVGILSALLGENMPVNTLTKSAYVKEIESLHAYLKQKLFSEKMVSLYETIERPLIPILAKMEKLGVLVDVNRLHELTTEFANKISLLEKEIHELAGHEFSVGSPKQLADVLFNELGLRDGRRGKSGVLSTDHEVLEALSLEHRLPAKVLEWRQFSKLKSTYSDGLAKQLNNCTGRIHTTFRMVATGRLSSSDPNLQNIPIRTDEGKKIRSAFVAEDGFELASLDYSQIELRVLAHIAGIKSLQESFQNSEDIHRRTASEVFKVPFDSVNYDLRRQAKIINFSVIYGATPYGLAQNLGISAKDASDFMSMYFSRYPELKQYMEDTKDFARKNGYVQTMFGRRCFIKDILSPRNKSFAERQAINAPIQGTAADIIKKAMINISKFLEHNDTVRLVLQVHDELLFEIKSGYIEKLVPKLKEIMETAVNMSVPIIVDSKIGKNWSEVK